MKRKRHKISGDQPCPCGSGKKYKKCCLNNTNLGYQLNLKGKKAEDFVFELSKKSFLEDWCYRNPILPDGKELCDLLVVYDEVAIIWQIKDLKLNSKGKYKKSEVTKNLRQIAGARRRLFDLKIPIGLENPRRGKELFEPGEIKEIYLISALLGKGEDICSFIEIIKGRIVHTFTRKFTEIVLSELDTIKDFIDYLKEKEELISANKELHILGGEEELLAYYLMNERSFEETKKSNSLIDEGWWEGLQSRPEYIAKKEEDKISYGWDSIINRAHTSGTEYEIIARELARPNRIERRMLSKAFYNAHVLAHNERNNDTFRRILITKGTTYCFVFLDDVEPRDRRKALLSVVCFIARGIHQNNKKVIGLATEMKIMPTCSYDFCLLEIPEWTDHQQKEMEMLQKETGIFLKKVMKYASEDEYPDLKGKNKE